MCFSLQVGEPHEVAAVREAAEEAGAVGVLGRCLGVFDNMERGHRTRVFVLVVATLMDGGYEDAGRRKRRWFPVEEAARLLAQYKTPHCRYLTAMAESKPPKAAAVIPPGRENDEQKQQAER